MLTRSPMTIPFDPGLRLSLPSPVTTPTRAERSMPWLRPEAVTVETRSRAARRFARRRPHGLPGAPQTAITASPMNFWIAPP